MTTAPSPDTPDDVRGSVTRWLDGLKAGNPDATRRLWERYFRRMVDYSQGRLWGAGRAAGDGEDVALSAFDSFCRGMGAGRLEGLGRERLWALLVRIISQKAADGMKAAIALLWERRDQCPGAVPVLFVHDGIVVEVPEADAEQAKNWLIAAMVAGMQPFIPGGPVVVEATTARSWGG